MILVTGATGMLGARLMFDLLRQGHSVRAFVRPDSDRDWVKVMFDYLQPDGNHRFEFIDWAIGDLLDVDSLEVAMKNCDMVFHTAAVVSFHKKDRDQMMKINGEGTANVCNVALDAGIKKLCYISSTAALGRTDSEEWVDEKATWKDSPLNTNYAISKYSGEREVWRISEEGMDVVVLNPSIIMGPGDYQRSSAAMYHTLDKGLNYYPPGSNAAVSIGDVSRLAIQAILSDKTGRFLATGENISYRELLSKVAAAIGKKAPAKLAKPWMMFLVRIVHSFRESITGNRALITRESVRNARMNVFYNSERAAEELDFVFSPLDESIKRGGEFYKVLRSSRNLSSKR